LALPDLQSQVSHPGEFWWHWGLSASLDIDGLGSPVVITDYPGPDDPEGALGYHSVDANYRPYAIVFAGLCRDLGKPTTGIISHELLEMLADQSTHSVNMIYLSHGTAVIVDLEVCDPCEGLYYEGPTGNLLSNFVFPSWFALASQGQVDLLGLLPGPLRESSGAPADVQTVTIDRAGPAGDEAERVIDSAAAAQRTELAAAFNSRVGVVDQLRARSTGTRAQFPPPAFGVPSGRLGPKSLERRKQPATPGRAVTVVRRENIPVFAQPLPLYPEADLR
jgi:hypothetical protein